MDEAPRRVVSELPRTGHLLSRLREECVVDGYHAVALPPDGLLGLEEPKPRSLQLLAAPVVGGEEPV